ncbi:MAG: ATP-binding protein [Actinobacteria bacterium]|nr:ATP-binding protein [Actinomycetota bacterium]
MKRHPQPDGRGVGRLLADFGHQLPTIPAAEPVTWEPRLFQPVPRRGLRRPDRGWSPAAAPVSVWRMTSDQAPVLWPFVTSPAIPPRGAQIGIDYLSRTSFHADPNGWVLDETIPVSNPNMITFGKPGMGKSATVKAFVLRMLGFGYKALILGDVKDEYEHLCRAVGVSPIAIGQGLNARINPLEFGPLKLGWEHLDPAAAQERAKIVFSRWATLIRGLVGSQKIGQTPVPYGPSEDVVVDAALRMLTGYTDGHTRLTETTIPALWHLLDTPTEDLVAVCRYASERHFLDSTRLLRDALAKLVGGTLKGLFDDHTTIALDWTAPIQSLSLSRLEGLGDEATGMALLCLNSWGRAMRETAAPGDLRIVVRDEVWKIMRLGLDAVKSLDADLRLSRRDGDIQYAIGHKPTDLESVGDAGSQAAQIAKDLLHLADTKILHGQDAAVAHHLASLLDLTDIEVGWITDWCRQAPGRAVWKVGEWTYKVETILHPLERQHLAFTSQNLLGAR